MFPGLGIVEVDLNRENTLLTDRAVFPTQHQCQLMTDRGNIDDQLGSYARIYKLGHSTQGVPKTTSIGFSLFKS